MPASRPAWYSAMLTPAALRAGVPSGITLELNVKLLKVSTSLGAATVVKLAELLPTNWLSVEGKGTKPAGARGTEAQDNKARGQS